MGRKNILSPPTSPPSFVMRNYYTLRVRQEVCSMSHFTILSTCCVRDMQIRNMDDQEAAVCCLPRVWNNATRGNSCHYIYIMHSNT